MTLTLEYEVLTHDEAEAYFKRQVDEKHIEPYVEFVSRFDVGESVRVAIKPGTDAESARTIKRNLNTAAKRRQAGNYVMAADGKTVLRGADGKPIRNLHFNDDGTPKVEPVQLRWKADTHKETKTKDGKTEEVLIVDKLVMLLSATKPGVTKPDDKTKTVDAPSESPKATTGPAATSSPNGSESPTASSSTPPAHEKAGAKK